MASVAVKEHSTGQGQVQGQWAHMAAGGFAGSFAVLFLHPFDVIKTRLQVQDGLATAFTAYKGPIDAVRTIARQEGLAAFYKGLTPALIGSGVSWAAYFYIYEHVKSWHCRWQKKERLSAGWNMLSAAQAGATVCLITNPIWLVKTRLQLQRMPGLSQSLSSNTASIAGRHYRGFVDALARIAREEGIRGLYKGLGPSLLLQSTHGAIQFSVYEELKYLAATFRGPQERAGSSSSSDGNDSGGSNSRSSSNGQQQQRTVSSPELSLFAAASKLSASIMTYPTQVIRSRLQQRMDDGRSLVYRSATQVVRLTWQREGLRGFYKGMGPALLRVMPQSAVTLVVYENVLRLINSTTGGAGGSASASS